MNDCVFCRIASGEIPSSTLYEDQDVRVILDINPASVGHALILPKDHAASLLEYPSEKLGHVFEVAQKLGNAMKSRLHCDGINIIANCGQAAGQTVDHFHVHVIPRYADKTKDSLVLESGTISSVDPSEIVALLQEEL